eukprot:1159892-Pelagomonas_calceolata.AAC.19
MAALIIGRSVQFLPGSKSPLADSRGRALHHYQHRQRLASRPASPVPCIIAGVINLQVHQSADQSAPHGFMLSESSVPCITASSISAAAGLPALPLPGAARDVSLVHHSRSVPVAEAKELTSMSA